MLLSFFFPSSFLLCFSMCMLCVVVVVIVVAVGEV